MANAKIDRLRNVPLFADCSGRVLEQVATLVDEVDVQAGTVLTREGERGREFFVLLSGRLRVEREGREIHRLVPGDFLGEISLIDGGPRTATVVADYDSKVLVVEHHAFNQLLEAHPMIQMEVLKALARRVRRLEPDAT